MLDRLFKKNSARRPGALHPTLDRLSRLQPRSADCTVVRAADGREIRDEVGRVSFYRRQDQLFTRDRCLFLVPPSGFSADNMPFSGRGEVLSFRFYHHQIPYRFDCRVDQRVRFSDRLLDGMVPRTPVGYRLTPVSHVAKNENRRSLRFAHIRGVIGPQVFPNFRFDLFVERVRLRGPAHECPPEVVPFPGDDPVPEEVGACKSPEDLVMLFHRTLAANPPQFQEVHVTRLAKERGPTGLVDLGYTPVLGLKGIPQGAQIHLRRPRPEESQDRKASDRLRDGDALVLQYVGRHPMSGQDFHYRLGCRVFRCGLETLVVRPRGGIRKQTGLPVIVRDFSVSGVGLQNSPILEAYLLGETEVPRTPEGILARLQGMGLLMHFYPRLHFPNDMEAYRPRVPAAFSVLGELVRGRIDTGKDAGRITELGVAFQHDPADYDPETFAVTAWEPLRGMRENPHFKEIHRALNAFLAYLER